MPQSPRLREQTDAAAPSPRAGARTPPRLTDPATSQFDRSAIFTRPQLWALLAITLCAAVLRLYNLGTWSLWVDEAHTFRDIVAPIDEFWATETSRYPLSYLLLRCIADVFSLAPVDLSEDILRLPFAFFGIACVPALALVARGMIGRRSAMLAALFLAISPWHIYWSQNARSYSMVLFFCLIALGAAFYGIQRRSVGLVLLSIGLFFVGGFCHPSANVLAASALIYFLIAVSVHRRRADRPLDKWAPLLIVALLATLVILSLPILERMWVVKRPRFSLFHLIQTVVFYVGLPMLVAAVGGALCLFDRGARSATFLTCMVVLPLLGISVLSSIEVKVTAQYAFAILPAVYMLAAVLVNSLARVFPGTGLRSIVLRLVPLAMIVMHMIGQDFLYFEKEGGWRPRFKEAVSYIRLHAKLGGDRDLVVLTTNGPSVAYYFDPEHARGGVLDTERVQVLSIESWDLDGNPEAFLQGIVNRVREQGKDLWVVLTMPELQEKDKQVRVDVYLRSRFKQVRRLPSWTGPKDMVVLIYHLD